MSALIIPKGVQRIYLINVPVANGQSLSFTFAGVTTQHTVTNGAVTVTVPASAATVANNGAFWTLKQGATVINEGKVYVTVDPAESDNSSGVKTMLLGPADPVPPGTAADTVIFRKVA